MTDKRRRQRQILDLLGRNRIESQEQLSDLLEVEGVRATQSTLSRDLRELGVAKTDAGYRQPAAAPAGADALRRLGRELRPRTIGIDAGGTAVVLRSASDADAREVAARIERAALHDTLAALPIGPTVLVLTRTPAAARELARRLRSA